MIDQELESENLSQKDIMKYLLHSATREELQAAKVELKSEMSEMKAEINKLSYSTS